MYNQDHTISVHVDLSDAAALERSERTLRHALAAVLFKQLAHQLHSGLCTVAEVFAKIADENGMLPKLQPGDLDPMCGLRVLSAEESAANLNASFKKWEACRLDEDPRDENNWVAVIVVGQLKGADNITSRVRNSEGNEFYVDSGRLREKQPPAAKAPFRATHEVLSSRPGIWLPCKLVKQDPTGVEIELPGGSVVAGLSSGQVRLARTSSWQD